MVSLYTKQRADRQSNATVDIPADVKDALKKFRFKKSTSNSAISGTFPPSMGTIELMDSKDRQGQVDYAD